MKVAIYHPNMHYFGGGETVALTIASILKKNHDVTVFVTRKVQVKKLEEFFGLDLAGVEFKVFGKLITHLPSLKTLKPSLYARSMYKKLNDYELVIDTCSNGLFEKPTGVKSICYVHFPNFNKKKKGLKSLLNSFIIPEAGMFEYSKIICNSEFTQKEVKRLTKHKSQVIYPPVKTNHFVPVPKRTNNIVTIGRFSPEKKLEVLIDAYIQGDFKENEFHIIGASGSPAYLRALKEKAKGHNIVFHENMPHEEVLTFLSSAKYYWHARGYGEKDPTEYENFGITTVEAMAAGCIPIVIHLGAQPEIIKLTGIGETWKTIPELIKKTKAAKKSRKQLPDLFSIERFEKELQEVLSSDD